MKTPNLFIVGAAKAGTTYLYSVLKGHHDIFFPKVKEPNFFSTDIKPESFRKDFILSLDLKPGDTSISKGKEYQTAFIRDKEFYYSLFGRSSNHRYSGDSSTTYLFSSEAAQNIHRHNPESKIIIALRNPIQRAFSHYLMDRRMGFNNADFKTAFLSDLTKPEKGWGEKSLYAEIGFYFEQVKRYMELFPPENILIVFSDEMKSQKERTLQDIWEFLKLKPVSLNPGGMINQARLPKFQWLNQLAGKLGVKSWAKRVLPPSFKERLKQVFFSSKDLPELSKDDAMVLWSYFEKDVQNLSWLIDKDLSCWEPQSAISKTEKKDLKT